MYTYKPNSEKSPSIVLRCALKQYIRRIVRYYKGEIQIWVSFKLRICGQLILHTHTRSTYEYYMTYHIYAFSCTVIQKSTFSVVGAYAS